MASLYVRPDEMVRGSVTGTVDADFDENWLINGNSDRPVKRTGDLDLTVTPDAAVSADLFAIVSHTVADGNTVDVTDGGTLATIAPDAWGANDIPLNPFTRLLTPINIGGSPGINDFHVICTSNPDPIVIGEFVAGTAREMEAQLRSPLQWDPGEPFTWEAAMAPYDDGTADARRLASDCYLSDTGLADVQAWYESTRRGTRPTLLIPDDLTNDAWWCIFRYKAELIWRHPSDPTQALHHVSFEFVEIPRVRW